MLDVSRKIAADFRLLAIARSYDDLHAAIIARVDELEPTRLTLDAATGLPDGYCGKLLGRSKVKVFGLLSLGALLEALGLVLVVAEDPQISDRCRQRLAQIGLRKRHTLRPPAHPSECHRRRVAVSAR